MKDRNDSVSRLIDYFGPALQVGMILGFSVLVFVLNQASNKDKHEQEYVKLAITMLQQPVTEVTLLKAKDLSEEEKQELEKQKADKLVLRQWAIMVFQENAPVKLLPQEVEQLKNGEMSLPSHYTYTGSGTRYTDGSYDIGYDDVYTTGYYGTDAGYDTGYNTGVSYPNSKGKKVKHIQKKSARPQEW
jgi:hypothetical protein